jgi:hypothetical protein
MLEVFILPVCGLSFLQFRQTLHKMNNSLSDNDVNIGGLEGSADTVCEQSAVDRDFYDKLNEKKVSEGILPKKLKPTAA